MLKRLTGIITALGLSGGAAAQESDAPDPDEFFASLKNHQMFSYLEQLQRHSSANISDKKPFVDEFFSRIDESITKAMDETHNDETRAYAARFAAQAIRELFNADRDLALPAIERLSQNPDFVQFANSGVLQRHNLDVITPWTPPTELEGYAAVDGIFDSTSTAFKNSHLGKMKEQDVDLSILTPRGASFLSGYDSEDDINDLKLEVYSGESEVFGATFAKQMGFIPDDSLCFTDEAASTQETFFCVRAFSEATGEREFYEPEGLEQVFENAGLVYE